MFNSDSSNSSSPKPGSNTSDILSQGTQAEQAADNSWSTVQFPGTIAIEQIPGPIPYSRNNAMDSSSHSNSTTAFEAPTEQNNQRETELLNLVRDLNECNDVLLAKVSQLEDSLERSQAALQAEIDRSGEPSDRDIVQLVTELEQSNQALQHHHRLNETFQTELNALRDRNHQLETEHTALVQQNTEQSQALSEANNSCRDLRARLQRQQRYTLQFKAALEKCLTIAPQGSSPSDSAPSPQEISIPKIDEIRPWESTLVNHTLDPQLESMIRGIQPGRQTSPTVTEAEDQLWHDLARVMEPEDAAAQLASVDPAIALGNGSVMPEEEPGNGSSVGFTEPSPWAQTGSSESTSTTEETVEEQVETPMPVSSPLSPEAAEILARVQSGNITVNNNTYLPAVSAQGSPSPIVNPLKPQKRIGSLAAVDLPSFPRLKKQSPPAKA